MYTPRNIRFSAGISTLVALLFGISPVAYGQTTAADESTPDADRMPEEIIVYGQKNMVILQHELFLAQKSFFDLFNTLNSDNEFDVKCKKRQKSISERRLTPRCESNFSLRYAAWASSQLAKTWGLSASSANVEYLMAVRRKHKEMWDEIAELARTNPAFREKIRGLMAANHALEAEKEYRDPFYAPATPITLCPNLACID